MTEQEEFYKIYGLEVVSIPTHRPMIRDDEADLVFRNENAKFEALIDEVEEMTEARGGRSWWARSASRRARCSPEMLKRRGIKHEVLNAKFHEKEAPDRGAGGAPQGRDHRHQHGRPRHGHPARRQSPGPGLIHAPRAGHQPGRGRARRLRRGARHGEGADRRGARAGGGGRRPAHHRHGAPRRAPHRQPAARPRRPPGRPGIVTLLPVPRGHADEALRLGPRRRPDGAHGPRGGRGHRVAAGLQDDRERPVARRGLQLRHPQARR